MDLLINNLDIIGFVIAVLSFILAVISAWDKISSIRSNWALRSNDKKIAIKEKQLAEVIKLNEQPNYFLAYSLQKLFIMIAILFLSYVFGIAIPHIDINELSIYKMVLAGLASFAIGNISGNTYRVCRSIIHYEQVVTKIQKQLDALRVKP
ncbi:hypothetical protein [Shewanella frigidimarina]|uniref:hypothetical protein n=1 Tax=Shewanella frigidimarina TaxID=56812 RepID=UPI003D7B51C1